LSVQAQALHFLPNWANEEVFKKSLDSNGARSANRRTPAATCGQTGIPMQDILNYGERCWNGLAPRVGQPARWSRRR